MDRQEQIAFIRAQQTPLYRYLRYLGADHGSAEDLSQEAFLAVLRQCQNGQAGRIADRASYLRGVARNLLLERLRKNRNSPVAIDSEAVARADAYYQSVFLRKDEGGDYLEALRQCLTCLPDEDLRLIRLQYSEGRSRAQMAQLAGLSEDGIKSAMRRIRARLAECIERRLGLPGDGRL